MSVPQVFIKSSSSTFQAQKLLEECGRNSPDVPGLPAHNKPVIELLEMITRAVDGALAAFRHDFAQEELARSVGLADWLR
jgi:hypothetical protein